MHDVLCPVLVGRRDELAALVHGVDAAIAGSGGVVFVLGEAGIGKSRLAREAVRVADERGAVVLRGRAIQRGSPVPYRPFAEALAGTAVPGGERALRWLASGAGDEDASGAAELTVAEAIARTLGEVGRTSGTVVLLEDLHWADPESLSVVEYLADHLATEPVLCLVTVRTGEGAPVEQLAYLLRERRSASALQLGPLPAAVAETMAMACLRTRALPDAVRRYLHDSAEGVPLFVEEMLGGLVDMGALCEQAGVWEVRQPLTAVVPLTYAEVVRRRLDALPGDDRTVLLAAAVLGRRFDWSLLPGAVDQSEANVFAALRRAAEHRLVEPDTDPSAFRFRHALGREAVLGQLLPPEQAQIARRALAAVDAAHPDLPGSWADLAVDLAERAGDRSRAVGVLVELGHRATRAGALGSAASALGRAESLAAGDADLLLPVREAQAHAAALAGDVDGAIRWAADALGWLGRVPGSGERRGRLHLALARAALAAGRSADARRHVDDARSHAGDDEALTAAVEALASHVAMAVEDIDQAVRHARAALDLARTAGAPGAACEALEVLGRAIRTHDLDESRALFAEALETAELHGLSLWRARALHELGTIDLYAGRPSPRFAEARAAAVDAGAPGLVALCDLHLASIAVATWDPEPGVEAGRRGADLSRRLGLNTLGMTLVHLASCHALANDESAMEAAIDEAADVAATDQDVAVGIPGRVRAGLALRRADFDTALAHLDEAMALARRPSVPFPYRGLWALLHSVRDPAGKAAEAARAEAAAAPGIAMVFNQIALDLAEATALGAGGEAGQALDRAGAALVRGGMGVAGSWEALVFGLAADAGLRWGWGGPAAVEWARLALASFDDAGLAELASWCRALLRDSGEPVPRRGRGSTTVPPQLRALGVTSREADVLVLLAEGIGNREVAARLHLSARTVERHVSNLLAKTGATDRRALAQLAAEAGLDG